MTQIVSIPKFKYKFSPTTNPFDTPVWVDISSDVLSFHLKYGRQFELNRMEAGTADFKLDNTKRSYDPTNSAGPYYGNLLPMRKFQVTAQGVIPIDAGPLTVTSEAAGAATTGYVVTNAPGTYSDGLKTATNVTAPSSLMSSTKGWVASCIRYGFSSTAPPGTTEMLINWEDDATHLIQVGFTSSTKTWFITRVNGASSDTATSAAQTFTAGTYVWVIAYWTATAVAISVNGGAFTVSAGTNVPTLASSTFTIGSA